MNYYPKRTWGKPEDTKSKAIKEMVDKREKSIATYTDKKEGSIVVTSSINNALDWCVNHPDWKLKQTDEDRWAWLDEIAKRFIEYFANKHTDFVDLYNQIKFRNEEIREKVEIAQEIEIGNEGEVEGQETPAPPLEDRVDDEIK